jgi:hypothetical protein
MSGKNLSFYSSSSAPAIASAISNDEGDDMDIPIRNASLSIKDNPELLEAEHAFFQHIATTTRARLEKDNEPIFSVELPDKDSIWDAFWSQLPPELKTWWSCRCCETALRRLAKLAQVRDDGTLRALMWPEDDDAIPGHLLKSVQALRNLVSVARIKEEFRVRQSDMCIGTERTGDFRHFFLRFPDSRLKERTAGVNELSTADATRMLIQVLDDYSVTTVRKTFQLLQGHKLRNASHHIAAIKWLLQLHDDDPLSKAKTAEARINLITRTAVSTWFQALSQLRSGALATLLEDVEADLEFDTISRKWNAINDPYVYMRPQAAPSAGNIAAAERLMTTLGITEHDMRRRHLTYRDLPENVKMWQARTIPTQESGADAIFCNVVPKATKENKLNATGFKHHSDGIPPTRISFARLVSDVLPAAVKLEMHVGDRAQFCFLITGLQDTKPLMQWHSDANRVSWYFPGTPALVSSHKLLPDTWNEVSCLVPFPHLWDGIPATTTFPQSGEKTAETGHKYYHTNIGSRYLFCLKGATQKDRRGLCLFPSLLKAEFHGVRSTIEAYSNKTSQEEIDDLEAKGGIVAGLEVSKGDSYMLRDRKFRVTDAKGSVEVYEIVLFD